MFTKMRSDQDLYFISFDNPPVNDVNIFEEDFNEMYFNKLYPEPL